ncbi:phytoene/squalene synthase family protein [Nitratireductor luteus]|uniref:phytoene/squalene synthase family protein n=1 Tax=Nitratireductor luteus TaxID=2976980 RepID=UPI00223F46A0|nr:phytoene/squalene synthase family protein [Nitratireductor luteus]
MAIATDILVQSVREGDPDRYLSTLYAPPEHRDALTALYAFNIEIASVRDKIAEALPGEVRLQWWRDALGNREGGGHPVAAALIETIGQYRLPAHTFDRMIEARIFDLYDDPMPDRASLEGYCGETASALIQLASLVLDPERAPAFADAAGHAGCAQAMAGLLRSLPIHRRRGQCYIPQDLLTAAGADRETLLQGKDEEAAARAVMAMVALGRDHYARFLEAADGLPASLKPAYLPAFLSRNYLDRVAQHPADALEKVAGISPIKRHWRMLMLAARG